MDCELQMSSLELKINQMKASSLAFSYRFHIISYISQSGPSEITYIIFKSLINTLTSLTTKLLDIDNPQRVWSEGDQPQATDEADAHHTGGPRQECARGGQEADGGAVQVDRTGTQTSDVFP